jgi:hypothetical protein
MQLLMTTLRSGYIGWMGMGGSIFQWYPELEIGFAFVPNQMYWFDIFNVKAGYLQKEVVNCVQKLRKENKDPRQQEAWVGDEDVLSTKVA